MAASDSTTTNFELYRYSPSLVAAAIFVVLFGVASAIHAWQLIRVKSWYLIPLLVGGLFETVGYIGRAISHLQPEALGPFIIQSLLILLAPALFAASIYMFLGRLIRHVGAEHRSIIRVNWLTKIFVGGDVLSFLLQSAGGGIMASGTPSAVTSGQRFVMIGLAVQLVFFLFVVAVSTTMHYRIQRLLSYQEPSAPDEVLAGSIGHSRSSGRGWKSVMWSLYAVSLLIVIRSIFRLIEYGAGNSGFLISHEVFLYIFDAVLMLCVLLVLVIWHPSSVIRRKTTQSSNWQLE